MSEFMQVTFASLGYRIITILSGTAIIYLGFILFRVGVFEKAGELKAAWGDKSLVLKQSAPGTFFVVFGAIIVSVSILKGADLESIRSHSNDNPLNATDEELTLFSSGSMPVPFASRVSSEVRSAIEKAIVGEELSVEERNLLDEWNEAGKRSEEERIRIQVFQPPLKEPSLRDREGFQG